MVNSLKRCAGAFATATAHGALPHVCVRAAILAGAGRLVNGEAGFGLMGAPS